MHIKSLHIEGFRSVQNLDLSFEPGITTLVGENNVGKSAIGLALDRLCAAHAGDDPIKREDHPYGTEDALVIEATLTLTDSEVQELLRARLLPMQNPSAPPTIEPWLRDQGHEVTVTLQCLRTRGYEGACIRWGQLHAHNLYVSGRKVELGQGYQGQWSDFARRFSQPGILTDDWLTQLAREQYQMNYNLGNEILRVLSTRFRHPAEFHSPISTGTRSGAVDSLTGADTASILLTLKNHRNPAEKARFKAIMSAFVHLFPRFDSVDAVEQLPGNGMPEVQFFDKGRPNQPLAADLVSAGIHEMLTLTTNLAAREGLVVFLEHPENHLHPHSKRALATMIQQSSERNQIIVVTHDPYFVNPNEFRGLRRFWWTPQAGTEVRSADSHGSDKETAQIETASRLLQDREMLFARAVLLVEDESLHGFLTAVAPTLGYNIDAKGVSIIPVGGGDNFPPYHTLLGGLGIPHVNLRDKPWGENPKFPPERFFCLGMEFEPYVDKQGLACQRAGIKKELGARDDGSGHRRVARALGTRLTKEQIPGIFDEVLRKAISLATGAPMN